MIHGFGESRGGCESHQNQQASRPTDHLLQIHFEPIDQKLRDIAGTLAFCNMTFESSVQSLDVPMKWRQATVEHAAACQGADAISW